MKGGGGGGGRGGEGDIAIPVTFFMITLNPKLSYPTHYYFFL